jgi:hypothetical protein
MKLSLQFLRYLTTFFRPGLDKTPQYYSGF